MTKIAIIPAHMGANSGDVAVTTGLLQVISRLYPEARLGVVAQGLGEAGQRAFDQFRLDHHEETEFLEIDTTFVSDAARHLLQEKGGGEECSEAFLRETELGGGLHLDPVSDADVLVYGGGEHLFSLDGQHDDVQTMVRLAPFMSAVASGKQCIMAPSTLGPFLGKRSHDLMSVSLRRFRSIFAREPQSQAIARGLRRPLPPIGVGLDPGFFSLDASDRVGPGEEKNSGGDIVFVPRLEMFGLRPGTKTSRETKKRIEGGGFEVSEAFGVYLEMASRVAGMDRGVVFAVQATRDLELVEALKEELALRSIDAEILRADDAEGLVAAYGRAAAVVSSRFHSVVFAWMAGVPAVGVPFEEHGHKLPSLMNSFGLGDLCLSPRKVGAEDIVRKILDAETKGRTPGDALEYARRATLDRLGMAIDRCLEGSMVFGGLGVDGSLVHGEMPRGW